MRTTQERMTSAEFLAMNNVEFDPPPIAPGAALIDQNKSLVEQLADMSPAVIVHDDSIVITIMGSPVAKQRARTGKGFSFTPKKTKEYEDLVKRASKLAMGARKPIEALVDVDIDFLIEPPKSWPTWKVEAAMAGYAKPPGRSDIDNFVKAIFDGGNGVVWKDDRQIVSLRTRQICCDQSRAIVTVRQRETVATASEWKKIRHVKGL